MPSYCLWNGQLSARMNTTAADVAVAAPHAPSYSCRHSIYRVQECLINHFQRPVAAQLVVRIPPKPDLTWMLPPLLCLCRQRKQKQSRHARRCAASGDTIATMS